MAVKNRFLPAGAGRINRENLTRGDWAIDGVPVTVTAEQLNNASGGLNYVTTWNATTNTPTLVSGEGTAGDLYIVDVAGTTDLDGNDTWEIGDWAIFNGVVWERVPYSEILAGTLLAINNLSDLNNIDTANSNLGSYGPSVNISVTPGGNYNAVLPTPKVIFVSFADALGSITLPACNVAGYPHKNNSGSCIIINGSAFAGAIKNKAGTLISSLDAYSSMQFWNEGNGNNPEGNWHANSIVNETFIYQNYLPLNGAVINVSPTSTNYTIPTRVPSWLILAPDAFDLKAILPIMNILGSPTAKGAGFYVLNNSDTYSITIYYSNGTTPLVTVYPGQIVTLRALSNANDLGGWSVSNITDCTLTKSTSDGTTITLLSVPVAETRTATIRGIFKCIKDDYSAGQFGDFIAAAIRPTGGDVTLSGTPVINHLSTPPPELIIDVDVASQTLRVRAQGQAATNYTWKIECFPEVEFLA